MTTLTMPARTATGGLLRHLDVTRDLGQVADLVELCFRSELDRGGWNAIREMRTLASMGLLTGWINKLAGVVSPNFMNFGFVWVEDGRVVGNVSMQPSYTRKDVWLIANVAVHPDYRRRGIARNLTIAALRHARARGAKLAQLQVDDSNPGARKLYLGLSFNVDTVRTMWQRDQRRPVPALQRHPVVTVRPVNWTNWETDYRFVQQWRAGSFLWSHPELRNGTAPTFWQQLSDTLQGQGGERWAACAGEQQVGHFEIRKQHSSSAQIAVVAHPDWRPALDKLLLHRALRRLGAGVYSVRIDHPDDDDPSHLVEQGFTARRTLWWMSYRFR